LSRIFQGNLLIQAPEIFSEVCRQEQGRFLAVERIAYVKMPAKFMNNAIL